MTGTISLSRAQLDTIQREAQREYPDSGAPGYWRDNVHVRTDEDRTAQIGVSPGTVVSVVIHPSLLRADRRVRVLLHRAYADSIAIGVLRDGSIIPSGQAA